MDIAKKTLRGIDKYFGISNATSGTQASPWAVDAYGNIVDIGAAPSGMAGLFPPPPPDEETAFPDWDSLAASVPKAESDKGKDKDPVIGLGDWHPPGADEDDDTLPPFAGAIKMDNLRAVQPEPTVTPISEFKNRGKGRGRGRHPQNDVHNKRHTIRPPPKKSGAQSGHGHKSSGEPAPSSDGKKHHHHHHHHKKDDDEELDDDMRNYTLIIPPQHKPFFTLLTTAVMLILYVWELVTGSAAWSWKNPWLWGSVTVAGLIDCGGKSAKLILWGEWWRFITPIYLHVSIIHIAMNMFTQIRLGLALERTYGASRVAPIYILSGIMGNIVSTIFLPTQTQAGASGAIFGLNGVLFVDLIQNWKLVEGPLKNFICLVISSLFSLVLGILPGIDNFCHIGGFVMGIVSALVFLPSIVPSTSKCPKMSRILTIIIVTPIMLGLLAVGFTIIYLEIDISCDVCQYIDCIEKWFGAWCGFPTDTNSTSSSVSA
ncbi:beta-lactamase family protein [Pelomyxa schiedti]|nr:beta-lactamase family protein [Pelomyxa schiedti]